MSKEYSLSQIAAIYTTYKDLNPGTRKINCCTCGKSIEILQIEDSYALWGHFIPRSVNRNLIFYPKNAHVQCINCNVYKNGNPLIYQQYRKYMIYRYGKNIIEELNNVDYISEDYYKQFYIEELLKLSYKFPELYDVLLNKDTGEVTLYNQISKSNLNNSIEEQFNTYSITYKSDLDTICKYIGSKDFIEYTRL